MTAAGRASLFFVSRGTVCWHPRLSVSGEALQDIPREIGVFQDYHLFK